MPWIVDRLMLDRAHPGQRLNEALARAGVPFHVIGRSTSAAEIDTRLPREILDTSGRFVVYGAHQLCRALLRDHPGAPLCFGLTDRTRYSQYTSALAGVAPFLNEDAVLTTWGDLRRRREFWRELYSGEGVFSRPDSGFKTFAGQCLDYEWWDEQTRALEQTSSVMPDTLVVVGPRREILGEFRFVAARGEIVAGSEYRWDDRLDVRRDWPAECEDVAALVAGYEPWQVDSVYTIDVALTREGPRVVELNSFCSAGLYMCDLDAVVTAVASAAAEEVGYD